MTTRRQSGVAGPRASVDRDIDRHFDAAGAWIAAPGSWDSDPNPVAPDRFRKALERAVKELPPRAARMLLLREAKRWEVERIGRELNVSAAHCRATLHAARLQVCHSLDAHGFVTCSRMAAIP